MESKGIKFCGIGDHKSYHLLSQGEKTGLSMEIYISLRPCSFSGAVQAVISRAVSNQTTLKMLTGLRHAILGNFSTDQMVIELTKI